MSMDIEKRPSRAFYAGLDTKQLIAACMELHDVAHRRDAQVKAMNAAASRLERELANEMASVSKVLAAVGRDVANAGKSIASLSKPGIAHAIASAGNHS